MKDSGRESSPTDSSRDGDTSSRRRGEERPSPASYNSAGRVVAGPSALVVYAEAAQVLASGIARRRGDASLIRRQDRWSTASQITAKTLAFWSGRGSAA
ncbi:hypothetical protein PI125_g23199 [Phytophthora idaei]|nr:hypothetical protein PI125_g23199 [Phytophthora idaei]